MNSAEVTITVGQVLFAAFVGFIGIFAAFAPAIGVTLHHLGKQRSDHDDVSIISFFVTMTITQFIVTVFTYMIFRIFDAIIKIDAMSVLGPSGVFNLFWTTPVVSSTPVIETWTTTIVLIRETLKMVNAFIPFLFVITGLIISYWVSHTKVVRDQQQADYFMYGTRIFAGIFLAMVAYTAWASFASYTLQMPAVSGGGDFASVRDAAVVWWRKAAGITV